MFACWILAHSSRCSCTLRSCRWFSRTAKNSSSEIPASLSSCRVCGEMVSFTRNLLVRGRRSVDDLLLHSPDPVGGDPGAFSPPLGGNAPSRRSVLFESGPCRREHPSLLRTQSTGRCGVTDRRC